MTAYDKSVDLKLTGTDAEKVAVLKTLTKKDIPCTGVGSVAKWLRETEAVPLGSETPAKLLLNDGAGNYYGLIQAYTQLPDADPELLAGIIELKSSIWGSGASSLFTTSPLWAPFIYKIVGGISQLIQPEGRVDLFGSFYALGGGLLYPTLTVEAFTAERTEAELLLATDTRNKTWQEDFDKALNKIGTPNQADGVAIVRRIADEMEAV